MNQPANIPPVIPRPVACDRVERFFRWVGVALLVCLLMLVAAGYAATGYFRSSAEMADLRDSLQTASEQSWHRKFGLNVGGFTFGAVRAGLAFVKLEDEPRVALQSIRSCEVGIYETGADSVDRAAMLATADTAMEQHGWERIVGVMDEQNLVGIYVPGRLKSTSNFKCCVLVFDGRHLVLVSSRANLEPAIQFALARADLGEARKLLHPPRGARL